MLNIAPEIEAVLKEAARDKTAAPMLSWLDMSRWDDSEPPPIEWSITNLVPREQVGLFSGVGGTGKTTTELLKDVAHVVGLPWLNWMPTQGPVIFVGCEDTDKVWRIRLTLIAKHFNTTFAQLIAGGFHLLNLYGQDATLFYHSGKSGRVETTPLYRQIYEAAGDLKPINISLDPLARIFAGNELDRTQVYGLVGHAQALALASGGSVTLLTHPSLQGISSGSGYSGSTAWHDAFRFRQYLRAAQEDEDEPVDPANDNGLRELTFMKNPIWPAGRQAHAAMAQRPISAGEQWRCHQSGKVAEDAKADDAFLDLLDRFSRPRPQCQPAPNSPNFAPTVFAKEGCGFNRKQLRGCDAPPIRRPDESRSRTTARHRTSIKGSPRGMSDPGPAPRPATVQLSENTGVSLPPRYSGRETRTPLELDRSKAGSTSAEQVDSLPPDAKVLGPAGPGERCFRCGKGSGVKMIRRRKGEPADQMHIACAAERWAAEPEVEVHDIVRAHNGCNGCGTKHPSGDRPADQERELRPQSPSGDNVLVCAKSSHSLSERSVSSNPLQTECTIPPGVPAQLLGLSRPVRRQRSAPAAAFRSVTAAARGTNASGTSRGRVSNCWIARTLMIAVKIAVTLDSQVELHV